MITKVTKSIGSFIFALEVLLSLYLLFATGFFAFLGYLTLMAIIGLVFIRLSVRGAKAQSHSFSIGIPGADVGFFMIGILFLFPGVLTDIIATVLLLWLLIRRFLRVFTPNTTDDKEGHSKVIDVEYHEIQDDDHRDTSQKS